MKYSEEEKERLRKIHKDVDVRTWMYFPIVMPLKCGQGPASEIECDKITWEVWDQFLESYGSFDNMFDALNLALKMNKELMEV